MEIVATLIALLAHSFFALRGSSAGFTYLITNGPHAVDLDNCFHRCPSIVLHPRRHDHIAAGAQLFPGCFIELISVPMLNVPEITVICSLVGCVCGGTL